MKRGSRKKRVRLIDRIRAVPHLFQKSVITHCLIVLTVAAGYSLYWQARDASMTELFTAIGAVFGSELCMTLLKTLFKKEKEETDDEDSSEQQDL